jgi:predicted anti-sigma-YlaC factor YlaD
MTHNHGKCKELLETLSDYVDGSLEEQLCKEIEQHMAECENCRVVIDTLKKTVSLYRGSRGETIELPAEVRDQLIKSLKLDQ